MAIKAVVFDFGGVICYPPSRESRVKVEEITGLPPEILWKLDRQYRGEWDRGTYDGAGYYRFLLEQAGVCPDDETCARAAQTDWDGWKNINPGAVQLMRDVKAAGFILGVLSNLSIDCLAWARDGIPVFKEADVTIFSSDYRIIKPEPMIYEKLREQTGCEYGDIVFFDDIIDNIVKAQELGIQGFLWTCHEAARERLVNMGLGI